MSIAPPTVLHYMALGIWGMETAPLDQVMARLPRIIPIGNGGDPFLGPALAWFVFGDSFILARAPLYLEGQRQQRQKYTVGRCGDLNFNILNARLVFLKLQLIARSRRSPCDVAAAHCVKPQQLILKSRNRACNFSEGKHLKYNNLAVSNSP
ncbi:hypothetical protein NDU88_000887 [Pleurodeles waltl]|uniref:Uncharacterized protein n=1 Tax=Pleurodeles waltl TaxID=8319 RepID=A0AAV7LBF1_PLEWA|nr:hypothetical protein NDU88_000887 [Pleurodeles waltl]